MKLPVHRSDTIFQFKIKGKKRVGYQEANVVERRSNH